MDTGQMMAVMQQMPARLAVPQAVAETVSSDRVDSGFAGLLQGISLQKTAQVTFARQEAALSESGLLTVPEILGDALSALPTISSNSEKLTFPVQVATAEDESMKTTLQEGVDRESQNVMLGLNGVQLALVLDQLSGRMPEAGNATDTPSEGLQSISQANRGEAVPTDTAVSAHVKATALEQQVVTAAVQALPASPEESLRPVSTTTVPTRLPVTEMSAGEKKTDSSVPVRDVVAATSQNETAVTESGKQLVMNTAEVSRPTGVQPLVDAEKSGNQPDDFSMSDRNSLRVVSEPHRHQAPAIARGPETVVMPEVQARPVLQQPAVSVEIVTATGDNVRQPEQQVAHNSRMTMAPHPIAAGLLEIPLQENELVLPAEITGQQEQLQKVRPATAMALLTAGAVSEAANGRPEAVTLRTDVREAGKILQVAQGNTAETIAAVSSEGKPTGSNGQETADRGMNGNFQQHVLHQQLKTEGSSIAGTTAGAVQNENSRTVVPQEQVVQQVRDRFVNHETKPGSEQIVLRLSPEHLGELKVNLSLEGQRLKVEIVAENRMVRDSLLQHTDALKESLSRQNIKMESFEVTTGGNGSTDSGRSQGDWRELAQQRQHNAWMPDGGYRLATQAAPAIAAYQMKSEHTMVDLHF